MPIHQGNNAIVRMKENYIQVVQNVEKLKRTANSILTDLSQRQHDHTDLQIKHSLPQSRIGAVTGEKTETSNPWLSKYTNKKISTFQKEDPD